MFSLMGDGRASSQDAVDLRRHGSHYDITAIVCYHTVNIVSSILQTDESKLCGRRKFHDT